MFLKLLDSKTEHVEQYKAALEIRRLYDLFLTIKDTDAFKVLIIQYFYVNSIEIAKEQLQEKHKATGLFDYSEIEQLLCSTTILKQFFDDLESANQKAHSIITSYQSQIKGEY